VAAAALEFSPRLLTRVARWSVLTAVAGALIGWAITDDVLFVASVALGAVIDIVTFGWMAGAAQHSGDAKIAATSGLLVVVRLFAKAMALVIAIMFPDVFNLWGVLIGVLAVETTLLIVAVVAGVRGGVEGMPRRHKEAGSR